MPALRQVHCGVAQTKATRKVALTMRSNTKACDGAITTSLFIGGSRSFAREVTFARKVKSLHEKWDHLLSTPLRQYPKVGSAKLKYFFTPETRRPIVAA